jgi:hypothetical protein
MVGDDWPVAVMYVMYASLLRNYTPFYDRKVVYVLEM